jgi:hypothetical protein
VFPTTPPVSVQSLHPRILELVSASLDAGVARSKALARGVFGNSALVIGVTSEQGSGTDRRSRPVWLLLRYLKGDGSHKIGPVGAALCCADSTRSLTPDAAWARLSQNPVLGFPVPLGDLLDDSRAAQRRVSRRYRFMCLPANSINCQLRRMGCREGLGL